MGKFKASNSETVLLQRNRDPQHGLKVTVGIIIAVLFLVPIIWMLFVSLKPDGYSTTNPLNWFLPPYTFDNYVNMIADSLILRWVWNSLIVGVITTILTLLITSLAAFAISQMKFRFKNVIFVFSY